MAFILLDVPYIGQLRIGGHLPGHPTHSEENGCWYASTCMCSYFWEAGPRLGVPAQYAGGQENVLPMGARYNELMQNENFASVDLPSDKKWSAWGLMATLGMRGPCYVRRGFRNATGALTGGHAICLIGANSSTDQVAVLDPWNDASNPTGFKLYTVAEFNDFFKWSDANAVKYSLMYKKQPSMIGAISTIMGKRRDTWKDYLA